jgi:hypothetical protein
VGNRMHDGTKRLGNGTIIELTDRVAREGSLEQDRFRWNREAIHLNREPML